MSTVRDSRVEHPTVVTVDPFKPAHGQKGLINRWQWVIAESVLR